MPKKSISILKGNRIHCLTELNYSWKKNFLFKKFLFYEHFNNLYNDISEKKQKFFSKKLNICFAPNFSSTLNRNLLLKEIEIKDKNFMQRLIWLKKTIY